MIVEERNDNEDGVNWAAFYKYNEQECMNQQINVERHLDEPLKYFQNRKRHERLNDLQRLHVVYEYVVNGRTIKWITDMLKVSPSSLFKLVK